MSVDGRLPGIAKDAAAAAEALAKATTPTRRTKQLTLGDHATGLQNLYKAVATLTGPIGVLPAIAGTVHVRRDYRAHPHLDTDHDYLAALDGLYDTAHSALVLVQRADIEPAFRRVHADCDRLAERLPRDTLPSVRQNVLALRSRQAGAKFFELGEDIWAPEGLLEDAAIALDATTTIVAALAVTCGHEVILLNAAYQTARVPRDAASAAETLTAAAEALAKANTPLLAATADARTLAKQGKTPRTHLLRCPDRSRTADRARPPVPFARYPGYRVSGT